MVTLDRLPDIICLTETKLNEDSNPSNVNLDGYMDIFECQSKSMFGGSGIYVHENHCKNIIQRPNLEINIALAGECEACFIEIKTISKIKRTKQTRNIIVGAIYRHPHDNHVECFDIISEKLSKINKNDVIFLMGDLNIDVASNTNKVNQYKNFLQSYGLRNYISKLATRITDTSETTIDHIITNINNNQFSAGVIQCEVADHLPIFGNANHVLPKSSIKPNEYRRFFSHTKQEQFCDLLVEKLRSQVLISNDLDLNVSLERLIKTIQLTYNDTFPLSKVSRRAKKKFRKPWVTTSILNKIRHKHKLYKI